MAEVAATVTVAFTQDEMRRMYERIQALEGALRPFIGPLAFRRVEDGWAWCKHCAMEAPYAEVEAGTFRHEPDCPVVAAEALLAEGSG